MAAKKRNAAGTEAPAPARTNHPGEVFDPWAMTTEESLALPVDLEDARSLMWQYLTAKQITERRDAIAKGTGYDVLAAIAECSERGLSIPQWLADLYLPRFRAVKFNRAASWDDQAAFGKPHPKGAHLARLRKDRSAGPVIFAMVRRILASDPDQKAIDQELFEKVAQRFGNKPGLGKTECMRIWASTHKELEKMFGPIPTKSSGSGKKEKVPVLRKPK